MDEENKTIVYIVDLETTVNGFNQSPGAEYDNNKILVESYSRTHLDSLRMNVHGVQQNHGLVENIYRDITRDTNVVIVGHNVMFDFKYILRNLLKYNDKVKWWQKITLIDTMYEVYLQSGHVIQNLSLEDTADLYDIHYEKLIDIGAWLKAGNRMEDIPLVDLHKYVNEDQATTQAIFAKQMLVRDFDTIYDKHKHLVFLAEMELVGLPIVKENLTKKLNQIIPEQFDLLNKLTTFMKTDVELRDRNGHYNPAAVMPPNDKFKWLSARMLSKKLTGYPAGDISTNRKDCNVGYRSGPILTKTMIDHVWNNVKPSQTLGYPMGEKYLKALLEFYPGLTPVENYMRYKEIEKLHSTYLKGMQDRLLWGHDRLNPHINITVTATGRTSSSDPNGQNFPPDAKHCIGISKDEGYFIEFDCKQLEICGAGELSGDVHLRADLNSGRDVHYETGKTVMGWKDPSDMTERARRQVKGVNFGILYGASAGTISLNTGLSKEDAKKLIKAFYDRYPAVQRWQNEVAALVESNKVPNGFESGLQKYSSTIQIGSVKHTFTTDIVPWTGNMDFSPTKTKNYPIQGWAGEEVVGNWVYYMGVNPVLRREGMKLHMMVHDSILASFTGNRSLVVAEVDSIAEQTKKKLKLRVPLTIERKLGETWSFK